MCTRTKADGSGGQDLRSQVRSKHLHVRVDYTALSESPHIPHTSYHVKSCTHILCTKSNSLISFGLPAHHARTRPATYRRGYSRRRTRSAAATARTRDVSCRDSCDRSLSRSRLPSLARLAAWRSPRLPSRRGALRHAHAAHASYQNAGRRRRARRSRAFRSTLRAHATTGAQGASQRPASRSC